MRLSFLPVGTGDLALLARWRGVPRIKRWWPDPDDLASIEKEFRPRLSGADPTLACICRADDQPIGYVQAYRLADEPEWHGTVVAAIGEVDAVGIDYFIGEDEFAGRGIGAQMIGAFVQHCWVAYDDVASVVVAAQHCWVAYDDVASVVVAVQQENIASWRSLERAGFGRVWEGLLESDDPSDQGPAYICSLVLTDEPVGLLDRDHVPHDEPVLMRFASTDLV